MNKVSKRGAVRIVTFSLALVALLVGLIFAGRQYTFENRRLTHTGYLRQTGELADALEHIGEELEKMTVASSQEMRTESAFNIWQLCGRSIENLTDLPIAEQNTEELVSFINSSGEYAKALSAKQTLTSKDRETAIALRDYSVTLAEKLYSLSNNILAGSHGYRDAKVPQLEKTGYMGFMCAENDAAEELSKITEGCVMPDLDITVSNTETEVSADNFKIEQILQNLPDDVHLLNWELSTLDGKPCACVDVELPSQNIYRIYFTLSGKEIKIERTK